MGLGHNSSGVPRAAIIAQREARIGGASGRRRGYDEAMRAVVVYLTLLLLLALSIGAGFIASDWPHWCARAHWCAQDWPQRR
jgi:hypothetical protein